MGKTGWTISETAKYTGVDAHVLRFWEEELSLAVERNQKGHRIYTEENLRQLKQIQELKKKGYQLKDIRDILHDKPVSDMHQLNQGQGKAGLREEERQDKPSGTASIAMARMDKKAGLTAVAMARADQASDCVARDACPSKAKFTPRSAGAGAGKDRHEEFYTILEKLVSEITVNNHREGRYKRLDEAIRRRQESRKMVAVTEEKQRSRKKYVK